MNLLERNAIAVWNKRLASQGYADESVIEFDVGKNPAGWQVECVATNRAVYLGSRKHLPKGGPNVARIPYEDIVQIGGPKDYLFFRTSAGREISVYFRATRRQLIAVVTQRVRDLAPPP